MCYLYGEVDIKRQAPNVFKMKLLGAQIQPVKSGRATLKDAMNEAYVIGFLTSKILFMLLEQQQDHILTQ